MNREEIKRILPHREPMLLIDEAEVDAEGIVHAHYDVRGDEFFLQGHFPGNPLVPGVIQCEIIAQSLCVLMGDKTQGKTPVYTGINNVKFKGFVKPGDRFEITAKLTREKAPFYFAEGEGRVDGKLCVKGEFSFALI